MIKPIRLFLSTFIVLLLVACQTDQVAFHKMTEEELIAYNSTVPLGDNVYCINDVRTGSFIRRTHCLTLQEILDQVNDNSHTLGVLNYGGPSAFQRGGIGIGVD